MHIDSMNRKDPLGATSALPRVLGSLDVVLFYAIAIVSLQWLSTAAQAGPSSLALWILAFAVFFVPSGFAVMELASRYEGEGGLYVWVKQAFGDLHGFVAGWSYVVANLVFLPTVLLFLSGSASYVCASIWPGLKDSFAFNATVSLTALWLVIAMNVFGLERAKWLPNVGAVVMAIVLVILATTAFIATSNGKIVVNAADFVPNLTDASSLKAFTTMMLALVGFELAPMMGSEIREPRRTIPRAIVCSGVLIVMFYLLGTGSLLVALPKEKIETVTGVPEAIAVIAEHIGAPEIAPIAALLITIATVGVLAAWITGGVRLPYVVGIDRHLPKALGLLHPRWHSPYVALIVTGAITTLLVLAALAGSTIGDGYQVLVDMTVALTFIPLVYMFIALPVLRAKRVGERPGLLKVPGGKVGVTLVTTLGVSSTLLSIGVALMPPAGDSAAFYFKVLGGTMLFLGAGLLIYFSGRTTVTPPAESRV